MGKRSRRPDRGSDIRSPRNPSRSAGLDGVRGLAALTVFGFHVWLYGAKGTGPQVWQDMFNELRIGLVCFFVLSGYLLYGAFARAARRQAGEASIGRYAMRRAARILPAYYVSLIGTMALLETVSGSPGVRLPDAGGFSLFFVFAQNYSADTIMKLNPVTWTLCLEVAFYVLLPIVGLFAYHVARGRLGPQIALLLGLVLVGVGWNVIGYLDHWTLPATKALPAYLPYFAVGMLAALGVETRRGEGRDVRIPPGWTAVALLTGIGLVVFNAWWHITSPGPARDAALVALHDLPAGIGFALVILAAAVGRGPSLAWLRARPLAGLGVVSYGFYLWHVPLILFVNDMSGHKPSVWLLLAIVGPLALAAGTASWHWVERPLLHAVNSRLARTPVQA